METRIDYSSLAARDVASPSILSSRLGRETASVREPREPSQPPPLPVVEGSGESRTLPPRRDPKLTAPEVSCRMVTGFIEYFRERQGAEFVDAVILAAGLPIEALQVDRWVSRAYLEKFVHEVVALLGVSEARPDYFHPVWQHWRKVGEGTLKPHLIGNIHTVLRALGSPGSFYRQVPKLVGNTNQAISARLLESGPDLAVLEFAPLSPTMPDAPWGCWNRMGLLEGAPGIWGLPNAGVEHPECMHHPTRPAKSCVYRIRYRNRTAARWLPAIGLSALGAFLGGTLAPLCGAPAFWGALTVGCGALALEGWRRTQASEQRAVEDGRRMADFVDDADRRYVTLWKERQALRSALDTNQRFSGYLSQRLVTKILEEPGRESRLEGSRTRAAVLFGDIVGFTRRCEKLSPEAAVEDLNMWFSCVDPVIHAHGGVIDKRIGDAVMVLFFADDNEGSSNQELWDRAIRCGLAMQSAMEKCRKALAHRNVEDMELRVGIAGGSVVQGTMGSPERYEYTVAGDVVNIAAHLESRAAPNRVLVLSEMLARCHPGEIVARRTIQVKGRQMPLEVTEIAPVPERVPLGPQTNSA